MGIQARTPHDTESRINSLLMKTSMVHSHVTDLVWGSPDILHYASVILRDGGLEACKQLWAFLVSGKGLSIHTVTDAERFDYLTRRNEIFESVRLQTLRLDPTVLARKLAHHDVIAVKAKKVYQLVIYEKTSYLGDTSPRFVMLCPAVWSPEERLTYFYRHLRIRCTRIPLLHDPLWAQDIWDMMARRGYVSELETMGSLNAWEVAIDEEVIIQFLSEQLSRHRLVLPIQEAA